MEGINIMRFCENGTLMLIAGVSLMAGAVLDMNRPTDQTEIDRGRQIQELTDQGFNVSHISRRVCVAYAGGMPVSVCSDFVMNEQTGEETILPKSFNESGLMRDALVASVGATLLFSGLILSEDIGRKRFL